ncbi:hypothetical protein HGO75_25020, partial [Mycobacterium tuberculosis]|nr:hypothetical protein [Mycobacterium tuberculosis]
QPAPETLDGVAPVPLEIMGRNGRLLLQAAKSLGGRGLWAQPAPETLDGVAPVPLEIMGRNGRLLLQAAKSLG